MEIRKDFLWGGSVSAHQSEGGNGSAYGKGLTVYDYLTSQGFRDFSQGIDTYHNFKEDAKLLKELGLNCYRFSIAWSRILPEGEGATNEQGLQFYDDFIDALIENGIEPMICLYHFDTPLALEKKYGGWLSRKTVDAFEEYTRVVMKRYGHKVKYYLAMNEQNGCPLIGLISAGIKPNDPNFSKIRAQLVHNMAIASASVTKVAKELIEDAVVMGMVNVSPIYPKSSKPEDVLAAHKANETFNHHLLHLLVHGEYAPEVWEKMKQDDIVPVMEKDDMQFLKDNTIKAIGMSYYASAMISEDSKDIDLSKNQLNIFMGGQTMFEKNPFLTSTEWGWTIDPTGLRIILNDLYHRYHLPIYVLESGVGVKEELNENNTVDDDYRIDYFTKQIKAVKDAICIDHVDVRSFLTWAPIDILSSQGEMKKRYGFIFVNRTDDDIKDLKRYKKKSFDWFKEVIKTNAKNI